MQDDRKVLGDLKKHTKVVGLSTIIPQCRRKDYRTGAVRRDCPQARDGGGSDVRQSQTVRLKSEENLSRPDQFLVEVFVHQEWFPSRASLPELLLERANTVKVRLAVVAHVA